MPDAFKRFDTALLPPAIFSGPGCRSAIAAEIESLGLQRVLIVCSPSLRRTTPFVDEIAAALGDRTIAVHDRIEPNNPDTQLHAAADLARELRIDGVISVGGGVVHDVAKAIAVMAPSGRGILDFVMRFDPPATFHPPTVVVEPLPVLTVPSTFSAAEVLSGGGVTDTARHEKLLFFHPRLTPRRVFLDGAVAASTPRATLAASGLNAVHHCLEALYSKAGQPISDALATAALAGLLDLLPAFAPDAPPPAVATVQRALDASAMSGLTYANSSLGVGHAICHSLGGRYGLSHGAANAVIVRHSLRFNLSAAVGPLDKAIRALGFRFDSEEAAAGHMVVLVDALAERLSTPRTLREIGLPAGQFDRIAEDVMADWLTYSNPRPVAPADVVALLQAAW